MRFKHKKILALAKGYRGRAKNVYTVAVNRVEKALQRAYIGRKLKKRTFRKQWIMQINATTRMHGVPYNKFIQQLDASNINLNRKVLASLAATEPYAFKAVVAAAGMPSWLEDKNPES